MKRFHWHFLLALVFLASMQTLFGQDDIPELKIIIHRSNPLEHISMKELSDIFLKRSDIWKNGEQITPIDQSESRHIRNIFCKSILNKPASAVIAFWRQKLFSGRDVPPIEKNSDAEVLRYVAQNPGAIGYIASNTSTEGLEVKTISIKE